MAEHEQLWLVFLMSRNDWFHAALLVFSVTIGVLAVALAFDGAVGRALIGDGAVALVLALLMLVLGALAGRQDA